MEFIAVVIAVLLVQLWGSGAPLHRDGWYATFCHALARLPILSAPTVLMLVCISLPVFAVLLVYYGVADQWWGLPKLMLMVLLLLYSLGRGDFRAQFEAYAQAWRRGDNPAAISALLQAFDPAEAVEVDSAQQLHALACERILYRGFERMFAVLFWFMLAGPALAIAYRLAFIYRRQIVVRDSAVADSVAADNSVAVALADSLLALMEWLPARALGLSFALVAAITDGLRTWISTALSHASSARAYLYAVGSGVLGLDAMTSVSAGSDLIDVADDELKQIQILLNRCLVLWLVVFALFQLVN